LAALKRRNASSLVIISYFFYLDFSAAKISILSEICKQIEDFMQAVGKHFAST